MKRLPTFIFRTRWRCRTGQRRFREQRVSTPGEWKAAPTMSRWEIAEVSG